MDFTITGKTDKKGNFGIYNKGQLDDVCKKNPDKRLIVTFHFEEKESKDAMVKYYYAKVVKEWMQVLSERGDVRTEKAVDAYLRSLSPVTQEKSLSNLSRDEMVNFLDHIKIVSLRDVNLFIEEPRCL